MRDATFRPIALKRVGGMMLPGNAVRVLPEVVRGSYIICGVVVVRSCEKFPSRISTVGTVLSACPELIGRLSFEYVRKKNVLFRPS